MNEITTVGLDLAKRVVSLCGEDAGGRVVLQRTLRREAVLAWFAQRPPCLVGMEACGSAHWFARELTALGHAARIIAPEFVRGFRLSGKNDANDAAAICAAVRQPQLRFVAVKSAEQQARLVVHRLRQGWQEERTAGLNRLRGLLAEFGPVYANSAAAALAGARAALADESLPPAQRRAVARQLEHLREIEAHVADCDREIAQDVRDDPRAQRAARLSEVGVLTASAIAATVADAQQFRCGRQFAAWLGITPRQHSTGGKPRLGRITRRGDTYLRSLLVQGARSALQAALRIAPPRRTRLAAWIVTTYQRIGYHKTLVAIANKHARLLWVLLTRDEPLRAHAAIN
ncbi:MAG: IS110 family transposase [Betaproteobacteria bacterium]